MEKIRMSKRAVKIHRHNLKHGFTEDEYIKEKVVDTKKTSRDYYLPVVKILSDMIASKNPKAKMIENIYY